MGTYVLINIATIALPLVLSFDKKVHFYKRWKYLFPAVFITGTFFLIWDVWFTKMGVWGFNPLHLSGIKIINLPLGEWLFFFTVPYATVFTYDVFKYYIEKDLLRKYTQPISTVLIILLLVVGLINYNRIYTSITFGLLALLLVYLQFVVRFAFLSRFYLAYMVILLPFTLVNGLLTGLFIPEEIVFYNDAENLSTRLFTIPIEDIFYGMLLILLNIYIYESLNKNSFRDARLSFKSS